jgi:hypothetical protein
MKVSDTDLKFINRHAEEENLAHFTSWVFETPGERTFERTKKFFFRNTQLLQNEFSSTLNYFPSRSSEIHIFLKTLSM